MSPQSSSLDTPASVDMTPQQTVTPASSSSSSGSSTGRTASTVQATSTPTSYAPTAGSSSAGRFSSSSPQPLTSMNPSSSSSSSRLRQSKLPMSPLSRSSHDQANETTADPPAPRMTTRPISLPPRTSTPRYAPDHSTSPIKSPCYVHGNLNQSASLSGWLNQDSSHRHHSARGGPNVVDSSVDPHRREASKEGKDRALPSGGPHRSKSQLKLDGYEEKEDGLYEEDSALASDDDQKESLTRQLAETAVGVREMSKQLGRTRVRSNISNILIVTKARDNRLIKLTRQLALYLMSKSRGGTSSTDDQKRGMVVYVDAQLATSKRFDAEGIARDHPEYFRPIGRRRASSSASINTLSGFTSSDNGSSSAYGSAGEGQLRYWTSEMCSKSPHLFDFVVTLGGDGTVLFTSWLFQKIVPPVLPFALGSLGFLTNFDFANYKRDMDAVIDKGIRVNLRMRFTCTVYRAVSAEDEPQSGAGGTGKGKGRGGGKGGVKAVRKEGGEILMSEVGKTGWEALEGGAMSTSTAVGVGKEGEKVKKKDKPVMCFTTRPVETFEVLNDLVVDRGPSPFVSLLELFGDEHHMTTVQADGLTVSTPTGSTAYSLSAGGSLVHPEIPALLITPICPHTLSFRPMLLPDSMELRICVPYNSRSTAWASFDGRGRVELKQGDHIKVTASQFPFPTVCADKQSTDWFSAIQRTLRWNEREKQKSFVVIEEPRAPKPLQPPSPGSNNNGNGLRRAASGSRSHPRKSSADSSGGLASSMEGLEPTEGEGEGGGVGGEGEEAGGYEDEDEEEEEEKFDIDDSSTTGASSHLVSPSSSSAQIQGQHQLAPRHLSAFQSHLNPLSHKSGLESPDRFAPGSTQPHPTPISTRHIIDALARQDFGGRGTHHPHRAGGGKLTPAKPNDGEEGQWDDIHDLESLRVRSGSRIPSAAERRASTDQQIRAGEDTERSTTPPPSRLGVGVGGEGVAKTPRPTQKKSGGGRGERKNGGEGQEESGSGGPHRAFAFFGQDESDTDAGDDSDD